MEKTDPLRRDALPEHPQNQGVLINFRMQIQTPFFEGFHIHTLGKKSRGEAEKPAREQRALKEKSLSGLGEVNRNVSSADRNPFSY
ncbi:hypothetical protein [Pontiella agarivorans]|uniref:Uncharacterized protein n=1 Tax=Pontiella agarivorans TaxID=3038953 RepID=A0ABU5MWF1_9BACT|nr:hypothetical protein [Pontiella agarivorans]MDZ8118500.1 hypothetical protein [Pontiella agarivorans]